MTSIEWTDKTWNPMVGCSRVAKANGKSGCDHCYAEGQVNRFADRYDRPTTIKLGATARSGLTFVPMDPSGSTLGTGARWTGAVWLLPDVLDVPLRRRKPTMYFVNSQSDVFHESVVDSEEGRRFIAAMFGVMAACPQHTFQILTKRPDKMREWFRWIAEDVFVDPVEFAVGQAEERAHEALDHATIDRETGRCTHPMPPWPLPNVWIGASVEDQESADERIPELLRVPAAVRFLSCEPLLGPVDLSRWLGGCASCEHATSRFNGGRGATTCELLSEKIVAYGPDKPVARPSDCPRSEFHWIIAGGESGHGARPMHPDWARSLRDQCTAAGVPFFFKQWGEYAPLHDKHWQRAVEDQIGDRIFISDWNTARGVWADGEPSEHGRMVRVGKGKAGRELDGRTWDEFPRAP